MQECTDADVVGEFDVLGCNESGNEVLEAEEERGVRRRGDSVLTSGCRIGPLGFHTGLPSFIAGFLAGVLALGCAGKVRASRDLIRPLRDRHGEPASLHLLRARRVVPACWSSRCSQPAMTKRPLPSLPFPCLDLFPLALRSHTRSPSSHTLGTLSLSLERSSNSLSARRTGGPLRAAR